MFTKRLIRYNSKTKEKWDLYVIIFILYELINMPYRIAFLYEVSNIIIIIDYFINVIFLVDIILMFYTTYQNNEGKEVKN